VFLFYSTFQAYESAVQYYVNKCTVYIHICTRWRVEEAIYVYSAGHMTRFQPMRLQHF